ncbi:hypothetical protein [Burkholderia cepacia]|uniref:hypothetical protein n=1 Tax=Burkholderia cepacia TaxID=292 RepID=UPI00075BE3C2|nr:hypothetical protein [Burkholderia cepacia]
MAHQTMSGRSAQARIDLAAERYTALIMEDTWTLERAHYVLTHVDQEKLDLFDVAGLAKAIACFQCTAD